MSFLKRCTIAFALASMPLCALAENNPSAPDFDYATWTQFGTESDHEFAVREMILMVFDARDQLYSRHANVMNALHVNRSNFSFIYQSASIFNDNTDRELVEIYDNAFSLEEIASYHADFNEIFSSIDFRTNCYAYAVNDIHGRNHYAGGLPQPGEYTGLIPSLEANNADDFLRIIIRGAEFDGLEAAGNSLPEIREGTYRVALMIREDGGDYHWLREGNDGIWSGKFGHFFPTRTDNAGNIITNPETADFGDYTFSHYFYVPEGGIDIQNPQYTLHHFLNN